MGQTSGKNPKGAELSRDKVPKRSVLIQNTLTHSKPKDWKPESFSLKLLSSQTACAVQESPSGRAPSNEAVHRAEEDLLTCTYWSSLRCMCYTGVSIASDGRD